MTQIHENEQINQADLEEAKLLMSALASPPAEPEARTINFYGEVSEQSCSDLVAAIYYLKTTGVKKVPSSDDAHELVETHEPMSIVISTEGGSVQDMFSAYDCMRDVRKDYDIETIGLGKVMSAGVLLLASGTKGKRRVGRNCRLMLHSISGGNFGSLKELQVDLKEVKWYQSRYIKTLAEETNMPESKIRSIFRRKTDTYFDAEQALAWGIVDEII